MFVFVLVFIILVLVLCLIGLVVRYRRRSHKYDVDMKEACRRQTQYQHFYDSAQQKEVQYQHFYDSVQQKEAYEKDVAKRRRITKKDREAVLERDDYTCQICGISKNFVDSLCPGLGDYLLFEIDHIQSVKQGGTGSDLDNLQTLCWRCNRKKGGVKTNADVQMKIDYGIDELKQALCEARDSFGEE